MFQNSADILNISLAVGFLILVVFISFVCFYLVLILRDVSKTTDEVRDLVSKVHSTVTQPLRALEFLFEKIRPYIESLLESKLKEVNKSKKK